MNKFLALSLVLALTFTFWAEDLFVVQNKPPMSKAEMAKAIAERKPFVNSLGMEFVWIKPGTFSAGADHPTDEELLRMGEVLETQYTRIQVEWPHEVKIKRGFYLATHETSWKQFSKLIQQDGQRFNQLPDDPVWAISLYDAIMFIEKVNQIDQPPGRYRLPENLEWEYACKAGLKEPPRKEGQPNADEIYSYTTPNNWGLYGMVNGLSEWTAPFTLSNEENSDQLISIPRGIDLEVIDSAYLTCSSISIEEIYETGLRLAFTPN